MRDQVEPRVKALTCAALVVAGLLLGACATKCPDCPTHTDPARIAAPATSR